MTPSELRQARCMAAIEDAVGFLDRKADARRVAAMLIQQFQSPGAILEACRSNSFFCSASIRAAG